MAKKILITGAGGFIGGFMVEEALKRGWDTWAAVRPSTSREYLADERIKFIELDFNDTSSLSRQLSAVISENGKWDYIIHNLGATKCANFMDFNKINYQYLRNFVDTLIAIDAIPEAFLLMSSLGAAGMGDEKDYTPISTKTIPNPNTRYGLSKLKAETYLSTLPDFPYIIFRPTGVYGPREKDYYMMMKSIAAGFDFSVGMRKQLLSFIYVEDLTVAAMDALAAGAERKVYLMSEDRAYTQREFRKIVAKELNKNFVMPIKCPMWIVYAVSVIAEEWGKVKMQPSTLNRDKFKIMKQRNWSCDISDAQKDFNFTPRHSLAEGIHKSIEWYKNAGWL